MNRTGSSSQENGHCALTDGRQETKRYRLSRYSSAVLRIPLWQSALVAMLVWASWTLAQPAAVPGPVRAPATGVLDSRIETMLREWERHTAQIRSLYTEFTRTMNDKVWKTTEVANGSARYLHPNRARLDIFGDDAESFVLTGGGEIWHFKVPHKQIQIFRLPPDQIDAQRNLQDGPLPFLFGTKPEKAKARYRLQILEEGERIVHLLVYPKLEEDKRNFVKSEIWLDKAKHFLPVKLMFIEPANGNEVTFDFKEVWTNVEINPEDFVPKRIIGWPVTVHNVADQSQTEGSPLRR